MTFIFHHIWDVIRQKIDELIFFKMVISPPTSICLWIKREREREIYIYIYYKDHSVLQRIDDLAVDSQFFGGICTVQMKEARRG